MLTESGELGLHCSQGVCQTEVAAFNLCDSFLCPLDPLVNAVESALNPMESHFLKYGAKELGGVLRRRPPATAATRTATGPLFITHVLAAPPQAVKAPPAKQ